jgi:hypothetical protein
MKQEEDAVEPKVKKTRTARRLLFNYEGAYKCIMRDHLGCNPLYGKEFPLFFRLSRKRVQLILEDLGRLSETSHPFYQSFRVDKFGRVGASVEAKKVLLPLLKSLADGVAPHCFADYFQVSQPMARECVKQFIKVIPYLYSQEYLRLPTTTDVKNITALHESSWSARRDGGIA